MKVNLGGERVGSGSKMKQYLHNYERSTHNLSQRFTSTMGVGMLIPFMCELVTRDDKYEIDLSAGLRTIPTKGPLFGKFKLQLDVYQCPMRLYQALLHNNPTAIGLKANQVKFPKMRLYGKPTAEELGNHNLDYVQVMSSTNSLVKYLGTSGIGSMPNEDITISRDILAIPILAYYDIFKNYYANKQEENAYTLASEKIPEDNVFTDVQYVTAAGGLTPHATITENLNGSTTITLTDTSQLSLVITGTNNDKRIKTTSDFENLELILNYQEDHTREGGVKALKDAGFINDYTYYPETGKYEIKLYNWHMYSSERKYLTSINVNDIILWGKKTVLEPFELTNIDEMRMNILSFHQLGQSYILDGENRLTSPYVDAIGRKNAQTWRNNLAGICVKTYQSDMYNCWLQTELIDGDNGISAITAIAVSDGKITIDALQFSEKLYNMLNRVAVAGNTYEDYLDAAYTESNKRFCESPMWIGGMADEITFEEIVQTAPSEGKPLGELGGRGNLVGNRKGGKITVKIDEPSFIIGIVSITPYVNYTQDNRFYNTEIDSLMDIHVPALDGIGFQNLIGERLHAASTVFNSEGEMQERPIIGKQPAWLEYMSAVDRAYGDFAEPEGKGYMVLNRDYLVEDGELVDATTYIDPSKFNYAFAYTELDAQNFWVSINSRIKARRLMSAKQIPTT